MTTSIAPGFDPTARSAPARRDPAPEPAGDQSFAAAMESQDRASSRNRAADQGGAPTGPGTADAERGRVNGERQAAGGSQGGQGGQGGQGTEDAARSDRASGDGKAQESGKAAAKDAETQADTAKSAADDRAKARSEAAAKTAAETEQAKASAKTLAEETAALVQAAKGRATAQAQQSATAAKSQAQAAKAASQVAEAAAGKAGTGEHGGQGRETVIAGQRVRLAVTGGEGRGQTGGRPLSGATAVAASAANGHADKAGGDATAASGKAAADADGADERRGRLRRDPGGLVQRDNGRSARGDTGPAGRFAEALSANARDGAQSQSAARLQAATEGATQSAGRGADAAAAARAEGGPAQTPAQTAAQGAASSGSQSFDPVMNGTGPASGTGQTGAGEAARAAQNPSAPRPTPSAPPAEQVAVQIQRAAANGQQRVQIRLHPAELGRIDVKLDMADDGTVRAVLAVDKPETLDLMQRDPRALEKALQAAGLKTDSGSLSFNLREDGSGGRQQAGDGDGDPAAAGLPGAPGGQADDGDLLAAESLRAGLGDGRVDIRV